MKVARIAVIGAGWAGLAAATTLVEAGFKPVVFEAARQVGGRARRVDWPRSPGETVALDNGQHIMIGAYRATLDLMARVGVDPADVLDRRPVALASVSGFHLEASRLPAPWHLLVALCRARGLSLASRLAMVGLMTRARRHGWRIAIDEPLGPWLRTQRQPEELIRLLWAPLCVAALNTPAELASTQVFLNVLRDSLGANAAASDLLLPRRALDELLPNAAAKHLEAAGAPIQLGQRVSTLRFGEDAIAVGTREDSAHPFDGVVLAVAAHQVAALLSDASAGALRDIARQCDQLTWQPISTVYLSYEFVPRLPLPMIALDEDPQRQEFGQWLFDKAALGGLPGIVAVVISAAGTHQELEQDALARSVERQLTRQLGFPGKALATRVISEKRATFACVPALTRPAVKTPLERLVLAGDYTASDYPSTLEGAIRSGNAAARELAQALARP